MPVMTVDRRPRDQAPRAQGARGRLRRRARDRAHLPRADRLGRARASVRRVARTRRRSSRSSRSSSLPSLSGAHRRDLAALGEPAQRFLLELADALARDAEDAADLLERLRLGGAVERRSEGSGSAARARTARRPHRAARARSARPRPARRACVSSLANEIAERRRVVLADRLVERCDGARGGAHLAHLLHAAASPLGDLLVGRRALELRDERRARRARSSARARRCAPGCGSSRALFATPRCTAWRIHHVAYVENLKPFRQSNFSAARIRPMIPSWIRSSSVRP